MSETFTFLPNSLFILPFWADLCFILLYIQKLFSIYILFSEGLTRARAYIIMESQNP